MSPCVRQTLPSKKCFAIHFSKPYKHIQTHTTIIIPNEYISPPNNSKKKKEGRRGSSRQNLVRYMYKSYINTSGNRALIADTHTHTCNTVNLATWIFLLLSLSRGHYVPSRHSWSLFLMLRGERHAREVHRSMLAAPTTIRSLKSLLLR